MPFYVAIYLYLSLLQRLSVIKKCNSNTIKISTVTVSFIVLKYNIIYIVLIFTIGLALLFHILLLFWVFIEGCIYLMDGDYKIHLLILLLSNQTIQQL